MSRGFQVSWGGKKRSGVFCWYFGVLELEGGMLRRPRIATEC